MKNLVKLAAVAALTMTATQAFAQSADVPFNGSITNTCTITAVQPGTLAASGNNSVLSSAAGAGAQSGSATVTTNSAIFDISADAPTAFGTGQSTADVTFEANYGLSGDTTLANGTDGGTATDLATGATTVNVDMSATSTSPFETGTYSAVVVLRCE